MSKSKTLVTVAQLRGKYTLEVAGYATVVEGMTLIDGGEVSWSKERIERVKAQYDRRLVAMLKRMRDECGRRVRVLSRSKARVSAGHFASIIAEDIEALDVEKFLQDG